MSSDIRQRPASCSSLGGCALLLSLLLPLVGCREVEPLGNLHFPEHAPDAPARTTPVFSFDGPQPLRFVSRYLIEEGTALTRLEEVDRLHTADGQERRVQRIELKEAGLNPVDRRREDRLWEGRHLTLGVDGKHWHHQDLHDWRKLRERDLGGWEGLALQLGLRRLEPMGEVEVVSGRRVRRLRLTADEPVGAGGELVTDAQTGGLVSVHVEGRQERRRVDYQAHVEPVEPTEASLPELAESDVVGPERARTIHAIQSHLKPFLPKKKSTSKAAALD